MSDENLTHFSREYVFIYLKNHERLRPFSKRQF